MPWPLAQGATKNRPTTAVRASSVPFRSLHRPGARSPAPLRDRPTWPARRPSRSATQAPSGAVPVSQAAGRSGQFTG